MRRHLSLKRETLAELTDGELGSVAGASAGTCVSCVQCWTTILGFRPTDACPPMPTLAGPPTLDCVVAS